MSLQRRLTVFFVLIVIVPLVAAALIVQRVVTGEVEQRALMALDPALDSTVILYNSQVEALEDRVRSAVGQTRFARMLENLERRRMQAFLDERLGEMSGLHVLLALDADRRLIAAGRQEPDFLPGVRAPTSEEILRAGGGGPGFVRTEEISIRVEGDELVGSVVGALWLDRGLLAETGENLDLAVVAEGRIVASTTELERTRVDIVEHEIFPTELDGAARARAQMLPVGDTAVMAWVSDAPIEAVGRRLLPVLLAFLLIALVVTTVLAYRLARLITEPLDALSEGARTISQGRFDLQIPVRSKDEIGRLATAFNEMTDRLRATVGELQSSRDQLQRAVRTVGETLRSTHDMNRILDTVIGTAVDAVGADAGALWAFTPTRDEVYPAKVAGMEDSPRVKVGEGIVGLAAERGIRLSLPDEAGGPSPARGEPSFDTTLAVPMFSGDRISGVLAVYRDHPDAPFSGEDLDTVVFLAEQGGVAIENIQLHEEAQRLSLTDGLTGVWNRRYLQMQFRQLIATATRFARSFGVLMLDLDHFKRVNDTYGHQRGDAVLVEFSKRVTDTLREVDTFVRYGGEEFVCLLPETDVDGALTTAGKILDAVRSEPFQGVGDVPLVITVSIGVACYPVHGDSYRRLIDAADSGLYAAKQEGRDRARLAGDATRPGLRLA
jgi:diguanylate cyclase (GGDEF)-like protein